MTDHRQRAGRRAAATAVAAALVAGGLTAQATLGAASAEPVYPSQEQVDGAQQAAAGKAAEIGAIESQLAAASTSLEQSQIAAATAAEDYNEAQAELERRTAQAQEARATADRARQEMENARVEIGRLAATSYRGTGNLGPLEAFLSAGGPQDVIDRASTLDSLGDRRQRAYQRMEATRTVSALLDEQAVKAKQEQEAAATAAEAARNAAAQAQAAAQAEVDRVAATRTTLIAQLATLRQTSVQLEQQRQAGLEAERIAREEAAARQAAAAREAEAARQAAAQRAAAERASAERAAADRAAADRANRDRPAQPAPAPAPAPAPKPAPPPSTPPGDSNGTSSGGQAAVEWARTQIGKDYEWGATGPDTYDCSGLTLRAWQRGGVSLPRTSRDQYRAVEKIGYSQLRPGDLIFYGEGNDASSIHHVAIYSGGGRMIEAARAGVPVRETSLRMSGSMDFAGRP